MARKKKTVVTPKVVVQTHPDRRIVWAALVCAGFLLSAWFGYNFGRMQAESVKPGAVILDREARQLIDRMEQERGRLMQRIARLEQKSNKPEQHSNTAEQQSNKPEQHSNTAERKPVSSAEAIVRALGANKSRPAETGKVPPPEADEAAVAADQPSNELRLAGLQVEPTDDVDRFRFSFSVTLPGSDKDQVVGTIWIAVNGLADGRPVRLSLKQISSETRPYLDMRFRGRQDVKGEMTLPANFIPENIAIEAKPYDKQYRGTSGKLDWPTAG